MFSYKVLKNEHKLILESLEVFIRICADEQKKLEAEQILKDLSNPKKEVKVGINSEPGICD
tara:strand:- start:2600 stop:2782 length:183 start_codon:yes stop_codon:yes gene_type:complete